MAAILIFITGCEGDDGPETPGNGMLGEIRFDIQLDSPTRALAPDYMFSDGKSISVLKCYIYDQTLGPEAEPVRILDVDIVDSDGNRGGSISVLLPRTGKYDFVFLGTSIPQTDTDGKLCYSTMSRTLNINYAACSACDEEMDCFYASMSDVTTSVTENTVVLSRPFAQINIGTQDYSVYNDYMPVRGIGLAVDGVYSSLDLMSGQVLGERGRADFAEAPVPLSQTYPVAGYTYVSMAYILVNLRTLVDVEFTVSHIRDSDQQWNYTVPDVAVERNYQTNIYGRRLLSDCEYEVNSVPTD